MLYCYKCILGIYIDIDKYNKYLYCLIHNDMLPSTKIIKQKMLFRRKLYHTVVGWPTQTILDLC